MVGSVGPGPGGGGFRVGLVQFASKPARLFLVSGGRPRSALVTFIEFRPMNGPSFIESDHG